MIAKFRFSKQVFVGLVISLSLFSCTNSKVVYEFNTTFKGYSAKGVSARGLFILDNQLIVAGTGGVISGRLVSEGGDMPMQQMGFEGIEEYRDVHCNSMGACLFMNSGTKGIISGMSPGGNQLKVLDTAGVFLDGMAFWNLNNGIVYGDPINGDFFLAKTKDGGRSWKAMTPSNLPKALENEGGFAASGTGIQTAGDSTVFFGTGLGEKARVFVSHDQGENWEAKDTPMRSGDSFGIYSMYFWSETEGVIIGGSYVDSTYNEGICQYTDDAGDSWAERDKGLLGYCSCVHGTSDGKLLVATGRMGTFYSKNKGKSWNLLTNGAYYSCYVTDEYVVLSGRFGTLEILKYTSLEK